MSLNSYEFLLFSVLAIVSSMVLGGLRFRQIVLLALNLYFIASFVRDLRSVIVLAVFLVVTYAFGVWRKRNRTVLPFFGSGTMVVLLWVFLFLARDGELLAVANPFHEFPVVIIGISYITFRTMSFLMEVEFIDNPSFVRYVNYLLFFPLILAGPIERYRRFEKQQEEPVWDPSIVVPALHRIANGVIKKYVIADNLAVFGILAVGEPDAASAVMLWVGALSQLFIIYLDFSGYCDIVIGIAALMGFRVTENFNKPFSSVTVQEFWERWHVTLSALVKDYVFTPVNILVIKRVPRRMQMACITGVYFFSMILIAMWHGVTWGFAAFGTIHGAALVLHQLRRRSRKGRAPPGVVSIAIKRFAVYAFVSVSLILWLKSASEWQQIFGRMLGAIP